MICTVNDVFVCRTRRNWEALKLGRYGAIFIRYVAPSHDIEDAGAVHFRIRSSHLPVSLGEDRYTHLRPIGQYIDVVRDVDSILHVGEFAICVQRVQPTLVTVMVNSEWRHIRWREK